MQAEAASVDGAGLLNRIRAFTRRFICYPSDHASTSHVLWIAHTHLMEAWFSTPRLAVLSPEPGSGKSRVLEITAMLVPNPLLSVNSRSEEHTSELQSLMRITYAVFCLKNKSTIIRRL